MRSSSPADNGRSRDAMPACDGMRGGDVPDGDVRAEEAFPTLTPEEFDRLEGRHEFSGRYQARKRALLRETASRERARQEAAGRTRRRAHVARKAAIALAAALVALPVTAWAVMDHSGFFAGAFGDAARASVAAHDEVQDYKDGAPVVVTYPSREYVEADLAAAERLLGAYVGSEPVSVPVGDHTLTVLSAVRDGDAMVVHYTLERQGGVTALQWDALSNEAKGAMQPNDAPFFWQFAAGVDEEVEAKALEALAVERASGGDGAEAEAQGQAFEREEFLNWGGGRIYVDGEHSTDDVLQCYEYLVFTAPPAEDAAVTLHVFPNALDGGDAAGGATAAGGQVAEVPVAGIVPSRTLSAPGVGTVSVSPLSMRIDHDGEGALMDEATMRETYEAFEGGFFGSLEEYAACLASEERVDIDYVARIDVMLADGASYAVLDKAADLDNTSYALGREGSQTLWMFNRLVDPDAVEAIVVNGVAFS